MRPADYPGTDLSEKNGGGFVAGVPGRTSDDDAPRDAFASLGNAMAASFEALGIGPDPGGRVRGHGVTSPKA